MASVNEFSKLKFNPFNISGKIEEAYSPIKSIVNGNEWYLSQVREEEGKGQKVLLFLIMMYDPGSPAKDKYQDIVKRKEYCLDVAGIDKESVLATTLVDMQDDGWIEMVMSFLIMVNARLWTLICINEQSFYEFSFRVLKTISGDGGMDEKDILSAATIKTKLMEACDDIHKRLTGYYRELTGDDDDLVRAIERKKRLTPEQIAKRGSV